MTRPESTAYLFLLERPSLATRREAAKRLRELGMTVVAQFGAVALEALVTKDQLQAADELGLFAARLKGPMTAEHLEKLSDEQRLIVDQWNSRFSAEYRKLEDDRTHEGKSWGDPGLSPPSPYSGIGSEDFKDLVSRYEERTGEKIAPTPKRRRKGAPDEDDDADQAAGAKAFVAYERALAKQYGDPTLAYHLARLAYRLEPGWRDVIARLPEGLLAELIKAFFSEAACWEMTGEMAVGIVFVESSRANGPKFSAGDRAAICQKILDGQSWLAGEHPDGNLSWVYDFQFVTIDVANGSGDPDEAYWRDPAMGLVSYNGHSYTAAWSGVAAYREDMRAANLSAHAMAIFVTPYANSWHAYAGDGRITLANKNNWGGWGQGTIDRIVAHETSHLFGAADEYTGSGTPCSSCETVHGCDKIPNGNCGACSHPHQDCVMDGNSKRLCGYTRGQIGWSTLFVETTTGDVLWAGTDDDVWVDIGDREFVLDTSDFDDRERNAREGYPIWSPRLRRQDIKRILIRKSPDGSAGGWRLHGVRVWFQGELVCEDAGIDKWLEDDDRTWVGCAAPRTTLVNRLQVKVTTGDVRWAGTDDDVTLTLAARDWDLDNDNHDDFERGHTDTFDLDPGTGLYLEDIHGIRIHKSPDGIAGGWRLKGVETIVNGSTIYDNQSIDKWLEDDDRTWSASL